MIEARAADGLFGQDRLVELLRTAPDGEPQALVGRIRDAVATYQQGPQSDDLAVLALHLPPGGGSA